MTILDFKNIYRGYSPCEEGMEEFERASSRMEVFSVITHPSYYDFVFKSIQRGWGPKPEDIYESFAPYINGHYESVHPVNGIECRTVMWCSHGGDIYIPSGVRIVYLIGVQGNVHVNDWDTVKIVVDKYSDINVETGENSLVYIENYGGGAAATGNVYIRRKA